MNHERLYDGATKIYTVKKIWPSFKTTAFRMEFIAIHVKLPRCAAVIYTIFSQDFLLRVLFFLQKGPFYNRYIMQRDT